MIVRKKCDIFESGADIICHQVNCQGVMGSGVAKQVRDRYPSVYEAYKQWCKDLKPQELLGRSQYCSIQPFSMLEIENVNRELRGIINIFGQKDYGYNGKCYTDYDALKRALNSVHQFVKLFSTDLIIAFPYKFGCARGGGNWNTVYRMIEEEFDDITVLICECNKG